MVGVAAGWGGRAAVRHISQWSFCKSQMNEIGGIVIAGVSASVSDL